MRLGALFAALALTAACHQRSTERPEGAPCGADTTCQPGLDCLWDRCRASCTSSADCPSDFCAPAEAGDSGHCLLVGELTTQSCAQGSSEPCPAPLRCHDGQDQCLPPCSGALGCAEGWSCDDALGLCRPEGDPLCGNGTPDGDEECDDGNTDDGDGCSSSCTVESHCGNGEIEPGEMCELGTTDCDSSCHCLPGLAGARCDQCVRYVDVDAETTGGDGLSWETAFATVQEGADAAARAVAEGTGTGPKPLWCMVWVAQGTYRPTSPSPTPRGVGPRWSSFSPGWG